ncbi:hypothetical protein PFISCL1PPCAC_7993, partial [Pristionchus fissidentatus]
LLLLLLLLLSLRFGHLRTLRGRLLPLLALKKYLLRHEFLRAPDHLSIEQILHEILRRSTVAESRLALSLGSIAGLVEGVDSFVASEVVYLVAVPHRRLGRAVEADMLSDGLILLGPLVLFS